MSYLARSKVPLFCTLFNRGGNRRAFSLSGEGGDHFLEISLCGGTKNQAKEFWARCPQGSGPPETWEHKHFGTDIPRGRP